MLGRLGLDERLPEVGLTQLVQDLCARRPDDPRAVLAYLAGRAGELSRTQAETLLALPLFPDLTDADQDRVVAALRAATRAR